MELLTASFNRDIVGIVELPLPELIDSDETVAVGVDEGEETSDSGCNGFTVVVFVDFVVVPKIFRVHVIFMVMGCKFWVEGEVSELFQAEPLFQLCVRGKREGGAVRKGVRSRGNEQGLLVHPIYRHAPVFTVLKILIAMLNCPNCIILLLWAKRSKDGNIGSGGDFY